MSWQPATALDIDWDAAQPHEPGRHIEEQLRRALKRTRRDLTATQHERDHALRQLDNATRQPPPNTAPWLEELMWTHIDQLERLLRAARQRVAELEADR